MSLLSDIQAAALDSTVNVADLLRRCMVLAKRLKHAEFAAWITNELNGYPADVAIPGYRRLNVGSVGVVGLPFGGRIDNAPIPSAAFPEDLQHVVVEQSFRDPISVLIDLGNATNMLKVKWGADALAYAEQHIPMRDGATLLDAWRVVSPATVKGVVDTVRTRALEFALAIEEEAPDAGDTPPGAPPAIPNERVTAIYYNTVINGGQANVGTSGGSASITGNSATNATTVRVSRKEALKHIPELRRDAEQLSEAAERQVALSTVSKIETELQAPAPSAPLLERYLALYSSLVTIVGSPAFERLSAFVRGLLG